MWGRLTLKRGFISLLLLVSAEKDYKLYQDFCLREVAACFVTKGVARVIPCSTSCKDYSDLFRGGTNDISNYQLFCRQCYKAKSRADAALRSPTHESHFRYWLQSITQDVAKVADKDSRRRQLCQTLHLPLTRRCYELCNATIGTNRGCYCHC